MATEKQEITVPLFTPRWYQLPILEALDAGYKRVIFLAARRHGKDVTALNYMIREMATTPGVYFYIFSTFSQGRRVIWSSVTIEGQPFLDYFPKELIKSKQSQEMKIEFKNGSIFQVVGSDNYNALMGTNPRGVCLSEYALQNPLAWEYLKPILAVNKGWALLVSTPRGKNHYYDLCQMAKDNEDWFIHKVTVEESGILTPHELEKERAQGMSEELIQQEYYCSFDSGVEGSYYGRLMGEMQSEGRICHVPYDKNLLVYVTFDIGFSDQTCLIFFQKRGNEILILDCYANHGYGFAHYLQVLREKPYAYGKFFLPHDGRAHNAATGTSYLSVARESGYSFEILDIKMSIMDGIERTRGIIPRIFIDKEKCEYLVKCLLDYHAQYDAQARVYRRIPDHNWSSDMADAFRYLAIASDRVGAVSGGMSLERLKEMKSKHGLQ